MRRSNKEIAQTILDRHPKAHRHVEDLLFNAIMAALKEREGDERNVPIATMEILGLRYERGDGEFRTMVDWMRSMLIDPKTPPSVSDVMLAAMFADHLNNELRMRTKMYEPQTIEIPAEAAHLFEAHEAAKADGGG